MRRTNDRGRESRCSLLRVAGMPMRAPAALLLSGVLALAACNQGGRPPAGSTSTPQPTVTAPQPTVTAAPAATSASTVPVAGTYTVISGDTVAAVANRYGVPIRSLIEVNQLQPPFTLRAGQQLQIPNQRVHIVAPDEIGRAHV